MKTMDLTRTGAASTDTGCLLTYRFSTDPEPLQVSTSQTSTAGRINVAIFEDESAVYCNEIKVAVPVGPDEADFSTDTPSDSVNTAKWSLESRTVMTGTELGVDDATEYAVFTFRTRDPGDNRIDYNLVLGLDAVVNRVPGIFSYIVQENSGTDADPGTYTPKKALFSINKELPRFYVKNFVATAPAAPTVPASEFSNGEAIRLSWESNGTYFRLYRKARPEPIYSGGATAFTLEDGISTDTTFILVASVTGDPSDDGAAGYEPIYLYEALTLTVSDPDLTPRSLAVGGDVNVGGALSTDGELSVTGAAALRRTTIDGTLGVTGASTMNDAKVTGPLDVAGKSTLRDAAIGGALSVSGATSLANTTVRGLLAASGAVGVMGAARSISPGSYTAKTDGIVVGYVSFPSNDASAKSLAWITGSTAGIRVEATGGNNVYWLKSSGSKLKWSNCSNPGSFTMPVQKGNSWSVSVQQGGSNEKNPGTSFHWIPLGSDAADTFERIGDPEPRGAEMEAAVSDRASEIDDTNQTNIDGLMDALGEVLGDALTSDRKDRLREAVRRLVFQEIHRPV